MNKPIKMLAGLMLAVTLAGVATMAAPAVVSADTTTEQSSSSSSTATHTLSNSYVVYGAGAPQSVYDQLNSVMGVDSSFKKLTATASDYAKYIGNGTTTDAAMISSVAIAPTDPGSGVKVNIKKYDGQSNITEVTAQQYAMVAQMAGVTDITIVVTANRAVSGESALTGVYKAFEADGHQLNSQNTAAANSVLDATQSAIDANKDDSSYPGKLMAAVGDTSKQIAQQKQSSGELATKADIQEMLNKALEKRGIADQTTTTQQEKIAGALVNFQNSPISSSKTYINNVSNTINNVKNSTGNLMNKAKNWANSEAGKETVKQAQSWLTRFINWIKSWF
ncbi:DUF1002 domain-containing protein [Limosilactobacillus mucosae]|uniref:DUF1002 domain-containing protein n=1 Tax=Limosilactobacillus mucosae TaxID=97478 RepID=UPI00233F2BA0|nr:DUF1002 domain-containing protein [Limosilactobacillus mucosae]MDC2840262.1 DUF1002 domain-containing protein [Limosilactobacillus mucosae]